MNRYVIIHGHFYQPPRDDPWTGGIEAQPSAAPFHDWNERIADQCYRPNAFSRLLDSSGKITDIRNNYRHLSFNFGPTLFSWLEAHQPATARRIVEADQESRIRNDGHGNALAQVYNHLIMPLATERDQLTQIRWAKRFFFDRFGREPEGLWLAETAINMETVRCCIAEGIRFVILSPTQAEAMRPLESGGHWQPLHEFLDTTRPYRILNADASGTRLPGHLDVFFFDNALSREVSFGTLLTDARILGKRINAAYDSHKGGDQAVVIATDGETFGHHKPFGDMCLAYFFKEIAPKMHIRPVNFGWFLAKKPPRHEVMLKNGFGEGSAWSCAHGVGRWVRNCGCSTGAQRGWNQEWRTPLRAALNRLKEHIDAEYQARISALGMDPWRLRDDAALILDDPSILSFERFLAAHGADSLTRRGRASEVRRLLAAQRQMLFAFTSCGWFFADVSGIETVQNIGYALRALELGCSSDRREAILREFAADLKMCRSNREGVSGRTLLETHLLSRLRHGHSLAFTAAMERGIGIARSDTRRFFLSDTRLKRLFARRENRLAYHCSDVSITTPLMGEEARFAVLVAHRDVAQVAGWVLPFERYRERVSELADPAAWSRHPDAHHFALADIPHPARASMAHNIVHRILEDAFGRFSGWMELNERELYFLLRLDCPLAEGYHGAIAFVCNEQWKRLVARLAGGGDIRRVHDRLVVLARTCERMRVAIDYGRSVPQIEEAISSALESLASRLSVETCERIHHLLDIVDYFKVPVSKNRLEEAFYPILTGPLARLAREIGTGEVSRRGRGKRQALLNDLVSFAARMNFSTDVLQSAGNNR